MCESFKYRGSQHEGCPTTSDEIGLLLTELAKRSSIPYAYVIDMEVGQCFHHAGVRYQRLSKLRL